MHDRKMYMKERSYFFTIIQMWIIRNKLKYFIEQLSRDFPNDYK